MTKVAVIVLNWNGAKLLKEFLPSVIRNTNSDIGRVIVADNASTDDSLEIMAREFPGVELLPFKQNYGFAGGYNRAIAQVDAEIIVLLNSDVEVTEGWLEPLIQILDDDSEIAAVQPKIKAYCDKNKFEYAGACGGYIDSLGFPFCRGRILNITEEDYGQYDDIREVFWCGGAALCIRKRVYEQVGGLDESFFAHMEEIDLCWRIRNIGYSLKVNPASVVYHLGGGSLPMNHPKKLYLNYRNNLLMLYKNLGRGHRRWVFFFRFFIDITAAMLFLLKGERANVKSVFAAYRAFYAMKKNYKIVPVFHKDTCIYRGSIIFAAYIRRVNFFSKLKGI